MNGEVLEKLTSSNISNLHKLQTGRDISKTNTYQTGTSALSHDTAGRTLEKQNRQFSCKDSTLCVTSSVIAAMDATAGC